MKWKKKS